MARILGGGHRAAALLERLRTDLGDDWTVLEGPAVAALGGAAALALHERHGIAVLASGRASGAALELRHALGERGVLRGLGGYLPIVALALDPDRARDPQALLRRAFLEEPPIGAASGWTRRVAELFAAAEPAPRVVRHETPALHADRDDAWRVVREQRAPAAPVGVDVTPEEHVVPAETVGRGGAPLWAGMALAICIVSGLLVGMAVLSHGNGPGQSPAATELR
jgi:hypothetical protein